tara:strand:+ start:44967 stop:47045 length:2079 start_codon:yes stop_codon:yes gene_type:complete
LKIKLLERPTRLIFLTTLLLIALVVLSEATEESTFYSSEENQNLALEIVTLLEKDHYVKSPYSSLRKEAFETYLSYLDPNKSLFLSDEVRIADSGSLKDLQIKTDLVSAFKFFNLYKERYLSRYEYQTKLIEELNNNDLYTDRSVLRDIEDLKRSLEYKELSNLWRDYVINDLIQLLLSGNELEDAKEKLKKRLDNQLNLFNQTRKEDVFDLFINSVARGYGPHSNYMSPKTKEDFEINMSLKLEGIGALLSSDGLYTTVSSLIPGGPAEKSDLLKPEDRIIGVDSEGRDEITDVIGWRIDDVVKLIRGPKDSSVTLEIIPASSLDDTNTKKIRLTRNIVKLEDQAAEKSILNITKKGKLYKIGVIKLPAFYFDFEAYQNRDFDYRSSSKDVKKLIKELKSEQVNGLVLDLRNNGGGSLFEANALAHLFIGRGTTVQIKTASGDIHGLGERWGYQYFDKPLAVLVNKFSASASEILAGVIQDYGRGIIVGTETFGKGTVQKVESLSTGQIKFTESKFYRVTGSSTQNKGVTPDIALPSSLKLDEIGENQYPKALKHDIINSSDFRDFNRVGNKKNQLVKNSALRVEENPVFKKLIKVKQWQQENQQAYIELNLGKRKQAKIDLENNLLLIENDFRSNLNLETYETYQEFLDREEDPETLNVNQNVLEEAANILSDLIEINEMKKPNYFTKAN